MAPNPIIRRLLGLHQTCADCFYRQELRLHGLQPGRGARAQGRARIRCFAGKPACVVEERIR